MTAIPRPLTGHLEHDAREHAHGHEELGFLKKYIFSTDHKIIGLQFLFVGLMFFVVGGLLAMLIRWQLAWPNEMAVDHPVPILGKLLNWPGGIMPADFYIMVVSMHATIMIFFVIIPLLVGTFGNYLIPLKIGAPDMAFPFMNGMAFWLALPAGTIMVTGFFLAGGAAAGGWTNYPPLSAIHQNTKWVDYGSHAAISAGPGAKADASGLVTGSALERLAAPLRIHDGIVKDAKTGEVRPAREGTWPAVPIFTNFLAVFGTIGFICAYYVHLGNKGVNVVVSVVLAGAGAALLVRGIQYVAWDGQSCWFLSLIILGFSSILGGVNYLTTIIKLRCPGMTMFRLPLSVWSLFITSLLVVLATPVLASDLLMNLLDHQMVTIGTSTFRLTSFFEPYFWIDQSVGVGGPGSNSGGGYVLLHQHLFWFYSHPAVYIMILPAMGMVSDILAVFSRKPIFGYRPMVYAMAGIAFLGFIVWAHHMFQSGMNPTLGTTFAVSTMFIAVPSAIKTFNWLGTLWGGNIRFTVPMLNALAFVAMFVIGGLSGIFMASTPVDVFIHDTYFIVAHIHYVLFGGSTFGIFAAIYFWYPKMFGRMMNNTLGYIHFFLSFIFFNGTFFAMHIVGMRGMPRRYAGYINYPSFADLQPMNEFISICAFCLGVSQIFFVINFIGSWIWGKKAPQNPWEATTLEWCEAPTPPPHGNFLKTPVVYHGPYEYSSPLVEEDWLAQTRYVEGADKLVVKH